MKAAICYQFGQPLVIEDVEIDQPDSGEVKVRLAATGICHSDVHLIRGEWGGDLPVVAGHEAAGIVEAVGPNVTLTQPGDHVVMSLLRSCGRCFFARLARRICARAVLRCRARAVSTINGANPFNTALGPLPLPNLPLSTNLRLSLSCQTCRWIALPCWAVVS